MTDTIRTDDPSFILLCRKAAAFDAIATAKVRVHREYLRCDTNMQYVYNLWIEGSPVAADPVAALAAIEAAMSTDRQTPKQTFGEVAE